MRGRPFLARLDPSAATDQEERPRIDQKKYIGMAGVSAPRIRSHYRRPAPPPPNFRHARAPGQRGDTEQHWPRGRLSQLGAGCVRILVAAGFGFERGPYALGKLGFKGASIGRPGPENADRFAHYRSADR